jgi:putative DNA primase/helicase
MAARPDPSTSDVVRAFESAMNEAGFYPRGSIQTDTNGFIRFDAPGDKAGKGNGFYKLKTGRYPVGWFGDWKIGDQHQWFFADPDRGELTKTERDAIKREQAKLKAEAQQARETRQAEIAEDASNKWGRSDSNVEGHPYLERKGITVPRSLRVYTARDGARLLAVPMYAFDMNGAPQLTNLQLIDPDGKKTFLKGGRVEGTFFSIKGDASLIVICEGIATAFSIWQATGVSVVAAFNAANLVPVAKDFARHRPLATLMIAADNDEIAPSDWAEKGNGRPWENVGRKKAEAAAKAVGCRWIIPVFADGPARDRTDFNDLHLLEGDRAVNGQVIGAYRSVEAEDAEPGAKIIDLGAVQDESWREQIPLTSSGAYDGNNVKGVEVYIANHRLLKGRLRYNQLTKEMELDGNPLEDHHVAEFRIIMHADRFKAKKGDVQDQMDADARRNRFDPLTDYLQGLKWDGNERLSGWLAKYLGSPDTAYSRTVGRKALIGSVARALSPGCKNDTMPVLEGDQGTGKSTALRYLFGDRFFVDHLPDFHSKDSFQQLQGAWCVEVAELSALSKADVKDVKQFLSRLVDKFRPPFGRLPVQVPRRSVFWGTVNPEEGGYLRDPTGARRFWPIETGRIDTDAILRDRDQLWAEAVVAFTAGETWHLEEAGDIADAKAEQARRREVHPWETALELWLRSERMHRVTVPEALTRGVKLDPDRQEPRHARQCGASLRALGWEPNVERVEGKVVKVFLAPEDWVTRAPVTGPLIGPQDDTPWP